MVSRINRFLLLLAVILLWGCQASEAPTDPDKAKFSDLMAGAELSEGLFDLYRLNDSGELYMKVSADQLGMELLHLVTSQDGLSSNWTMRGGYASKRIIRLRRDYNKLVFEQINTHYYFDPASPLSRAAEANLPPSILALADITDESEEGDLLVKVSPVFLSEAMHQITLPGDPQAEPGTEFSLGELNADKTRLKEIRSYPDNVDLMVNYVYENPAPLVSGGPGLTDDRVVVLVMQHSLVKLPDNDFQPRFEDPRLGYFTDRVTDQTSHSPTPYRDPIQRWNLVKKNSGVARSEPVEPIVFWLENTTPHEYRDVITDALLTWNQAFESAGFVNAVQVKVQPDDADWDAADIRYNVLRWTASDESPWGGYGPRFSDPRSGQIIGADIMLEFRWITSHLRDDRDFTEALLPINSAGNRRREGCQLGAYKQSQLSMARALSAAKPGSEEESELVRQSLYDLVTHEVGHTLGLNHNFIGSHYLSPQQLASAELTAERGVAATVMDYLSINFAASGQEQPTFYPLAPGPYDHWAIEYGYSEALADEQAERLRLDTILARSTEPDLAFGHDADDMRSSESGIDPRFMIFDQSADPVLFAVNRVALIESLMPGMLEKLAQPNQSWQEMYDAYLNLTGEWSRQMMVASRWVGGVYVDRAFQGQAGATQPLRPIPVARQRAAMNLLTEKLFAPDALQFDQAVYQYLQQQRRGFDLWSAPQDPKLLGRSLTVQKNVLSHLLHPVTLTRINDSALYGNEYSLQELMADLSHAVFAADLNSAVNSRRQQLQWEYIEQLLPIVDIEAGNDYDYLSRSAALYQLMQLQQQLNDRSAADIATRAHTAALLHRIDTSLDRD